MTQFDPSWPQDWSTIYDAMDIDRTLHLNFYTSLISAGTGSLLDLGCGTGSITVAIADSMDSGTRVVGVDLSPKMIEIARSRAPHYSWLVGDICAPPVEGRFDLIVICFHTLQALVENVQLHQAFYAIANLLTPTGRFAFDIYQPNLDWLGSIGPAPYVARRYTDPDGRRIDVIEQNGRYDADSRILSGEWTLRDSATGEPIKIAPIVQRVRQYFPEDIDVALAHAGMHWVGRFGELDRRPLEPGSKRQVYICARDG